MGIGNIFLILQNSVVLLYRLLNNWKYISKTCIPLRSIDMTPLLRKTPYIQKKIFGKFFRNYYVCKKL